MCWRICIHDSKSGLEQNVLAPSQNRLSQYFMNVSRYMAGRERIVDEISCFVDIEESRIDS